MPHPEKEQIRGFLEDAARALGWYGSKDTALKYVEGLEARVAALEGACARIEQVIDNAPDHSVRNDARQIIEETRQA